jgi:hypothetical protein
VRTSKNPLIKLLVKMRMMYADGKRWDYEPGEHYMGIKKSKKYNKVK